MYPWNSIRVESPSWWVPSSPNISDQGEAIGMPLRASDGLRAYNLLPAIFDIQVRKHEAKSTIKPTEAWILEDGLHDHLLLKVGEKLNEVAVFVLKGIYPKGDAKHRV